MKTRKRFFFTAIAHLLALSVVVCCEAADPVKVAVYTGGSPPPGGCLGVYEALDADPDIAVSRLETLSPSQLCKYPILVMGSAHQLSGPDMALPYEEIIRNYVEQGGSVVLTHFATGFVKGAPRAFPKSLFPEIMKAVGKVKTFTMKPVKGDHPILAGLPPVIRHGYWDHVQLEAGPKGTVLVGDDEGKAVAVCGAHGKGRVLALGNVVGHSSKENFRDAKEEAPTGGELTLLVNGIRWLAGADSSRLGSSEVVSSFQEIAGMPISSASNEEAIAKGYVIVPEPQQIALLGGRCPISADTALVISSEAKERGDYLGLDMLNERLAKRHGFTLEPTTKTPRSGGRILIGSPKESAAIAALCKQWNVDVPANDEGYALVGKDGTVLIAALTARGACYGVQSLIQLLRRDKEGTFIPNVSIRDWPDFPIRGIMVGPGTLGRTELDMFKKAMQLIVHLKGNTVLFENRWTIYDGAPDVFLASQRTCDYAFTMEEMKEVCDEAHRVGINVMPSAIPLGNTYACELPLNTPGLDEYQELPPDWKKYPPTNVLGSIPGFHDTCWRWSSPKVQKMLHDHAEEIIKAARPQQYVHLMNEEIYHFGISEHDKGKDLSALFADYINTMHEQMAGHGLKLWALPDHLLQHGAPTSVGASALSGYKHPATGHVIDTAGAIDMIPKDIIMNPWYYGPLKERPVYKHLIDKGFPVVAYAGGAGCGAKRTAACSYNASIEGKKYGTLGDVGQAWSMDYPYPRQFVVRCMEWSWTAGRPVPDAHVCDDIAVVQDFAFLPPKPSMRPNRKSFPVDISAFRNTSLVHRKGKGGWFRYGPHRDFRDYKSDDVTYEDVVFALPAGDAAKACVMLAGEDQLKKLRYAVTDVKGIPVHRKAASLVFLHTCMMKKNELANEIARYRVHYADGGAETVQIRFGEQIGGWMQTGISIEHHSGWLMEHGYLPDAALAYHGENERGERMTLDAFEWVNPHPDREIESVDIEVTRHDAGVRLALLAMSGVEPTETERAASPAPPAYAFTTDGLVRSWSFDEGEGDVAADDAGHHPAQVKGPTWDEGIEGGGLSFDGAGDYVDLGGGTGLLFDISDFTYEVWLKTESAQAARLIGRYARRGRSGGNRVDLTKDGRVFFYVHADNRENEQYVTSKTNVADGKWHQVVAVRKGNTLSLYVDGKLEATKTYEKPCLLRGLNARTYLGAEWIRDKNTYAGLIDEVRVYHRALTPEEVMSNYKSVKKAL